MKREELIINKIDSLPTELNSYEFISSMSGRQFMMIHDFNYSQTYMVNEHAEAVEKLQQVVSGIKFEQTSSPKILNPVAFVIFTPGGHDEILKDLYKMIGNLDARLCVSFVKPEMNSILIFKRRVEALLSKREVRMTKMNGSKFVNSHSTQVDLYYDSDGQNTLLGLLGELNQITATNGSAYKIVIVIDEKGDVVKDYLKSKGLILESIKLNCNGVESLYKKMREMHAAPFGYVSASRYLNFSDRIERKELISNQNFGYAKGELEIGNLLKDSVIETQTKITTQKSSLNLGTIITGLPGTGKTLAAMSIFSRLNFSNGKTSIIVISPTKEWAEFAKTNSLNLIRIYDSAIPMNLFKCYSANSREKFYENLAMLLAHASNAGPYQNSLEKCLLAAFRKIYSESLCPDPVFVYMQIEETIIEKHAKRTNAGVKYTKHGENIRAALENLRLMLFRPEFAATEGVDIDELLRKGVVFDLSNVGNSMKQFFYALLLNRIYSFADSFDENGNDLLRVEIVLEEAQIALSQNELSAVNLDLKQRIQDFRKKGIGLCLITHSVTDMPPSIRRLCQTKLYFRQSSDIAKYAAVDLGLDAEESISRLRSLEQQRFAITYIENNKGERISRGPVFGKINSMKDDPEKSSFDFSSVLKFPNMVCNCAVGISEGGMPLKNTKVGLFYLGVLVQKGQTDENGNVEFKELIKEKEYLIEILGDKKRNTRTRLIKAAEQVRINLSPINFS